MAKLKDLVLITCYGKGSERVSRRKSQQGGGGGGRGLMLSDGLSVEKIGERSEEEGQQKTDGEDEQGERR